MLLDSAGVQRRQQGLQGGKVLCDAEVVCLRNGGYQYLQDLLSSRRRLFVEGGD